MKDNFKEVEIDQFNQIRNEAIKEFAEQLKKYLCLNLREGISVVTIDDINKLVKRMTEEVEK